jgi:hypothetical protein
MLCCALFVGYFGIWAMQRLITRLLMKLQGLGRGLINGLIRNCHGGTEEKQ